MHARCYPATEVNFRFADLLSMPSPDRMLVVTPTYFDVIDVKNAYMEGQQGMVDKDLARQQWDDLYLIYKQLESEGVLSEVAVIEGAPNLVDMVFSANQSLPWLLPDGHKVVVMSNMRFEGRKAEVQYFIPFYQQRGYQIKRLPEHILLEGNGDFIAHPGRRLLWAGHGHRSNLEAAELLAELLETPIIPLKLISEYFYHLDTCFVPIDEKTVMLCASAFDEESLRAIHQVFETVIDIPEEEAVSTFSLNALVLHGPNSRHAILQKGSIETIRALVSAGCELHETDTSEFMKSGGSVFCMKMLFF
jgi:N-dimethylarginine dimethylaminohydrolase